jgi:hypothetical protein
MLIRRNREPAPQGTEPTRFADRATDLGALRDAVVDAAGVSTGLWLSYLFVLFYFAIAAGAVTHRDLFLENPVKLPFLNVELPLKAFFILGPLVFLIVHAYVLLHFILLAGKIGAFHSELQEQVAGDERRVQLLRQLPSNIFVQSLAGPRDVRGGPIGFLMRLVTHISLAAGPIALLILFQLQFLTWECSDQGVSFSAATGRAVSSIPGLSPIPRPDRFRTRSTSHSVAARSDCTNIPLAAGGAQEDKTILPIGYSSHGIVRFVRLDPPGLIRS